MGCRARKKWLAKGIGISGLAASIMGGLLENDVATLTVY
jgi:hypothetical protein